MKHLKVKIKQLKMAKKVSSQSHQHSKCQIATIPDVRCFHSGNCVELIQRRWTVNSMLLLLLCVLSLNDSIPSRVRLFSFIMCAQLQLFVPGLGALQCQVEPHYIQTTSFCTRNWLRTDRARCSSSRIFFLSFT